MHTSDLILLAAVGVVGYLVLTHASGGTTPAAARTPQATRGEQTAGLIGSIGGVVQNAVSLFG